MTNSKTLEKRSIKKRQFVDRVVKILSMTGGLVGLFFLTWILYEVVLRGIMPLSEPF